MSATVISQNTECTTMLPLVTQIRDIIKGSPFVKVKGTTYLKHPSSVDKDPVRYDTFISNAEFDEFTAHTERVMIGRMKLDDGIFVPPAGLEYLLQDVDKDGLSMRGLTESCCKNVMEVKWHLLLSDYKGVMDLPDGEKPSAQQIKDANPRATIKQYARENVADWSYSRINGRRQLNYLLLTESGEEVSADTGEREDVTVYLKLGLDDTGYFQQKRTESALSASGGDYGEKHYIEVGKSILKFIPVTIACDEEFEGGSLPMELGFLSAIGDLALYRYQMSGKYKECLSALLPTLHVTGVDKTGWEDFEAINGRKSVASGVFYPNIWTGENVKFQLLESSQSLQQFLDFFEDNKNKVRALGGSFKTDNTVQRTATEVVAESESITAILNPIADNVESAIAWQIAYCAMFEGKVKAEQEALAAYVEALEFALNKDFAISKLTVEEVKALLDVYMSALLPKDEFLKIMEAGGWTQSSAADLLDKLDDGDM